MARGYPDNWSPDRARTEQYQTTISTPANTAEGSKKETSITLEEGIITYLRVLLPYGSVGLLHIQIYYGEDQIAPKGAGSYHGDGDSFEIVHFNYPLQASPYELTVKTWNDDDTYEHEVDILCNVSIVEV